jgi:hypothetical protein
MKKTDKNEVFRSSDLYLCAFLIAKGAQLFSVDAEDPERVGFLLTPRPTTEDLEAWAGGWAAVNAGDYSRALRHLKRTLWAAKDSRQR